MTEQRNDSLAEMAGICPEITFTGDDGKRYTISPPKVGHLAEFVKYDKEETRASGLEWIRKVADLIPPEEVALMIQELKEGFTDWITKLVTPEGTLYMMYLRMRANHPELSLEEVGELVPVSILQEQGMQLYDLLGMDLFITPPSSKDGEASPPEMVEAEPEIKPEQ